MANEVRLSYLSGSTCYALLRNAAGQVYNTSGAAFEAWNAANIGDYDIALTDKSGDLYLGDFPSLGAATYFLQFRVQLGGSPATTDLLIDTTAFVWDGTSEVITSSTWGAGANTVTLTIRTTGGTPISGAQIWVYTSNDSSGSIVTPRVTNSNGQVVFSLDDGTFYAFGYKAGYTFSTTGSNAFTVSGATSATLDIGTQVVTGTAGYYAQSFLKRSLDAVRLHCDEPAANSKYSDSVIVTRLEEAFGEVVGRVSRNSPTPVVATYSITYVDGTYTYRLPATIQSIIAIYQSGDSGYRVFWDSRSHYNVLGRGVWTEGRCLRVQPYWMVEGATIKVEYIPQSPRLMTGTCTVDSTGKIITLGSPYLGTKDTRDNAYAGCLFRIIADSDSSYDYVQERTVASHDPEAGTVTLDVALDPNPNGSGGTTYFEIVPSIPILMDRVVPLLVAIQLSSIEGNTQRVRLLNRLYNDALGSVELQEFYTNLQTCARMVGDNYRNRRYGHRPW